jgi:hypothetical protein
MGKVIVLVVGIFTLVGLAVPAGAISFTSSFFSNPYATYDNGMPYSDILGGVGGTDLSSIYGPLGIGGLGGLGGLEGIGSSLGSGIYGLSSDLSSVLGYSPYSTGYTSYPMGTDLGQVSSTDPFSDFGSDSLFNNMLGTDMLQTQTYGPPPTQNITNTLVGQLLQYNDGSGMPLEYQVEPSDIGNITGTQYDGQNAWNVLVGQNDMYWNVILNSDGTQILAESQVQ